MPNSIQVGMARGNMVTYDKWLQIGRKSKTKALLSVFLIFSVFLLFHAIAHELSYKKLIIDAYPKIVGARK